MAVMTPGPMVCLMPQKTDRPPHPPSKPHRGVRGIDAVIEPSPADPEEVSPITNRADGYYWLAPDGRQEFGPFESYELARADRDGFDDAAWSPGETLREAEDEIGMGAWIDPETGEPAQGQSPPHLEQD